LSARPIAVLIARSISRDVPAARESQQAATTHSKRRDALLPDFKAGGGISKR